MRHEALEISKNTKDATMLLMNHAADRIAQLADDLRKIGADLALGNAGVSSIMEAQHDVVMTSARAVELMSHALLLLAPEVDNEQ